MMTRCRALLAVSGVVLLSAPACAPAADPSEPVAATGGGASDSAGANAGSGIAAGQGGAAAGAGGSTAPAPGGASGVGGASPDDCAPALPSSLFCDPLQPLPKTLAPTGLFPAAPDFTQHAARLLGFTPNPPLWSDGLEKERYLLLPSGQKVDDTNPKAWLFPVGTVLVKTFFDDSGVAGARRPIETRIIRRVGTADDFTEYDYYLYRWNEAGTDATLVVDDRNGDSQATQQVEITIKRTVDGQPFMVNGGQPFDHTLPSRDNCSDCHQQNGNAYQTFIGFDEIRLNHKRTPASAKTQLEELRDVGVFTQASPAAPRRIVEADANLLKTKELVLGNCVHCHNEKGKVFDLAPEVFVANTVGQMTTAQSVAPPDGWLRVKAGQPEMSVLFVQARRTPLPMPTTAGGDRLRPMPPIGVNDLAADQAGLAAMEAWIKSLP
jgi:hypothetical protein